MSLLQRIAHYIWAEHANAHLRVRVEAYEGRGRDEKLLYTYSGDIGEFLAGDLLVIDEAAPISKDVFDSVSEVLKSAKEGENG